MGQMKSPKGLLLSVGGSLAPLIYSIDNLKPEYLIFFASKETEIQIGEVLGKITHKPKYFDKIITESAEALDYCIRAINETLPRILRNWGIELKDFAVDYTGGTKTMSAALVLMTIEDCSHYSYIGGVERDKGGVGVVIDGKEKMLYAKNPWDELAIAERKRINLLFNRGRYKTCLELIEQILGKVSEEEKPFYSMLRNLIEGYYHWNRCDTNKGNHFLSKAYNSLKLYSAASPDPYFRTLLAQVEKNVEFLRKILQGEKIGLVYDLIASAKRCAELEHKYDDAIARLYRALEKRAQIELENLGIRHNNVEPQQIPETIREEYVRKYTDSRTSKIKLPLMACYVLLREIGNELGKRFSENERNLMALLEKRNLSKLAHGDRSLSEDDYRTMSETLMDFFEIKDEDLPAFPELKI